MLNHARCGRFQFAAIAACLAVGSVLVDPSRALAQSAGDNGSGPPEGTPHTCAIENTGDRGFGGDTYDLACGTGSRAGQGDNGDDAANTAIGGSAVATGIFNTALGSYAQASGDFSDAIGSLSSATASGSVALGSNSVANRSQTVSVGDAGYERQIVNVADGTEATDVVNLRQMEALDLRTLADANAYTDIREALIRTDMAAGDAATLSSANTYTDSRETTIRADMAAGDAATLGAASTYADSGDVRTLASANTYADAGDVRTLGAANVYTDQQFARMETVLNGRFRSVEVRLDQVTAMSAAFAVMAGNSAGARNGSPNRLVVGVGNYGSETAMSVGYSRVISDGTAFNAGVSFTGGQVMSGGSFGFAW